MGLLSFLFSKNKPNNKPIKNENYEKQKERVEKEYVINQGVTREDIEPFKGKPFSLSGKLMYDCGIPYFYPSESDKKILESDIGILIDRILETRIFKKYVVGNNIDIAKICLGLYTSTMKIKKHPISVQIKDEYTFYQLYYTKEGRLGKAEFTYTPNNKTGYVIDFKEYPEGLLVRKIISYPLGGGPINTIYIKDK